MASSKLVTVLNVDDQFNNALMPLSLDVDEVYYVHHHFVDKSIKDTLKNVLLKYKDLNVHFLEIDDDEKEIGEILRKEGINYIDIGGEKYLSLVLFEKSINEDFEIVYYDSEENSIKTYKEHRVICERPFRLSIDDLVNIGGGTIIEYMHNPIDVADKESLNILNDSIEASVHTYSKFTSFIQKINSLINKINPIEGRIYPLKEDIIQKIITDENYHKYNELGLLHIEDNELIFPTVAIAKLFGVSGAFLENYLYHKLIKSKLFDDVKMSCVIDFSGNLRKYPIICEIDCLVIKDNRLLFVSCKSNKIDAGDLNEIKVHNTMFGNKLSRPVLCTIEDLNIKAPSVYGKARELGVAIIDNTAFENRSMAKNFYEIITDKYTYEKVK